jgi:hypothetical protein
MRWACLIALKHITENGSQCGVLWFTVNRIALIVVFTESNMLNATEAFVANIVRRAVLDCIPIGQTLSWLFGRWQVAKVAD